jgi:hypothetical protein
MLSFVQYISEIFQPSTKKLPAEHPDYQGVYEKTKEHTYMAPEVARGIDVQSIIREKKIGRFKNAADVSFYVDNKTVGPQYGWPKDVAHNIMRTVHGHLDHYIRTQKPEAIFYNTTDPVRDRIYQMAVKRYNIPAFNYSSEFKRGEDT